MIGIIIQARLASTRLPKKILKPFGESNLLLFLIKRLENSLNIPIVVATSTSNSDDELCDFLRENNIKYFRGSETDVLQRFIDTANEFKFDSIIRVCSDSPLIDIQLLKDLIQKWDKSKLDYLSYSLEGKPTVLCHFGVFAEFTSLSALKKINNLFDNEYYREHVTYGIYNNLDVFNIELIELLDDFKEYSNIRLTVDTLDDYNNLLHIYNMLSDFKTISFLDLAKRIVMDEDLVKNMKLNIDNNIKK